MIMNTEDRYDVLKLLSEKFPPAQAGEAAFAQVGGEFYSMKPTTPNKAVGDNIKSALVHTVTHEAHVAIDKILDDLENASVDSAVLSEQLATMRKAHTQLEELYRNQVVTIGEYQAKIAELEESHAAQLHDNKSLVEQLRQLNVSLQCQELRDLEGRSKELKATIERQGNHIRNLEACNDHLTTKSLDGKKLNAENDKQARMIGQLVQRNDNQAHIIEDMRSKQQGFRDQSDEIDRLRARVNSQNGASLVNNETIDFNAGVMASQKDEIVRLQNSVSNLLVENERKAQQLSRLKGTLANSQETIDLNAGVIAAQKTEIARLMERVDSQAKTINSRDTVEGLSDALAETNAQLTSAVDTENNLRVELSRHKHDAETIRQLRGEVDPLRGALWTRACTVLQDKAVFCTDQSIIDRRDSRPVGERVIGMCYGGTAQAGTAFDIVGPSC